MTPSLTFTGGETRVSSPVDGLGRRAEGSATATVRLGVISFTIIVEFWDTGI